MLFRSFIQAEFHPPAATIGLLASMSTLMLAAFTLGGGTVGDRYGRRRFILVGTGGMVSTAALSMVAPNAGYRGERESWSPVTWSGAAGPVRSDLADPTTCVAACPIVDRPARGA